jgi:hypothetical protein
MDVFRRFFMGYKVRAARRAACLGVRPADTTATLSGCVLVQGPDDDDSEPHYRRLLAEMFEAQVTSLNINCMALHDFSDECARLYDQLVKYPQEVCCPPAACRRHPRCASGSSMLWRPSSRRRVAAPPRRSSPSWMSL